MIETLLGLMDEALLEKTEGEYEDDNEVTTWQEWRLVVKRDVQVKLKPIAVTAELSPQLLTWESE